jgi:hypothetical protein
MISFTKSSNHYSEDDKEYIYITTEAQTLGDLTTAFRSFLNACGYQCVEEEEEIADLTRKQEDFFI